MYNRTVSIPWLLQYYWNEVLALAVCVSLDVLEYFFWHLLTPGVGDLVDLVGITFSVFFFNWSGIITFLELIPGLDILPIFTFSWLMWYVFKRRKAGQKQEAELDSWR
ncbi:MAG: hypothetical protein QGF78_04115 [Candidatus Bathyarchaeota archaeon]|nr:hypothetical protein [Candidatus Bathyarchaeota archaeon]